MRGGWRLFRMWLWGCAGLAWGGSGRAADAGPLVPLTELRVGRPLEWRVEGVPAVTNPFDPVVVTVDAEWVEPGGARRRVPAFWYRPYQRSLVNGTEVVTATGPGEWRLRGFGMVAGRHALRIVTTTGGGAERELGTVGVDIAAAAAATTEAGTGGGDRGFLRVSADRQYFETREGQPLPLVGADTCWPGKRGTYDYDDWLPAMAGSGWNWGRLWMWPNSLGLETAGAERLNYRLDRAWQLDRILDQAAARGMVMLLCLDYHGMFESTPDYWGGNNFWPKHPYNVANGGPCATPREFFTSSAARRLYQARLRYLVARYGAHPGLFAWQFFNEIDNVYRYLDAAEVADWHAAMGRWLGEHDPWQRLRTTSLTSQSDRPELWGLPEMDFAVYHCYSMTAPARGLAGVVAGMRTRYGKPVLIGEAGVDWRGWARESDPHLRGFRQLLWGGVASGSAGTSMSWWWEAIHAENAYPYYRALTNILAGSRWGTGAWEPARFRGHPPAPISVGEPMVDVVPFDVVLVLDGSWGTKPSGQVAVPDAAAAGIAPQRLNAFVHGTAHADLRVPCRIDAWFGEGARWVGHLNSVSDGAVLSLRVDGAEIFRRSLPNRDGKYDVNNEYNEDIAVGLPAGRHLVEVRNAGADWFCLDWIRLERVRPSRYAGDWIPSPVPTGVRRGGELLVYLVAPGYEYPAQATVQPAVASGPHELVISNLPAADYAALWFRTTDGQEVGRGTAKVLADGVLVLMVPPFAEDLVGHVFTPPALRAGGLRADGAFVMGIDGVRGRAFGIERSADLREWIPLDVRPPETNGSRPVPVVDEEASASRSGSGPRGYYRLRFRDLAGP